jgi:ribosomal subunit interface protein
MKIIIHTRHADLASDFKEIVEEKLASMERFSVVIDRIEVEVTHEANPRMGKHSHKVVVASHGSGPALRAEATEFNDLAAFDVAIKSIELQIRKLHEKEKSHDRSSIRTMPLAD